MKKKPKNVRLTEAAERHLGELQALLPLADNKVVEAALAFMVEEIHDHEAEPDNETVRKYQVIYRDQLRRDGIEPVIGVRKKA